jgi:holo-[acyl-carrier protein] synthase
MIYGIGTDIVQISRVQTALRRSGGRFAQKILGADEFCIYQERKAKIDARGLSFLASRFAAKEAFSKALGLGMRAPMAWQALQILNSPNGRPTLHANGSLSDWMSNKGLVGHVTLSDEVEYAVAFVIVEKV